MTVNAELYRRIIALADLVTPMAVRAAATLRIADHIGEGGQSLVELARCTGARPRPLGKLMDHMVSLNILDFKDGRYHLTDMGSVLRREGTSPWPFEQLDIDGVIGRTELSVIRLMHTLRTGESVYHGMYGTDLWSYINGLEDADDALSSQSQPELAFDVDLLMDHPCWRTASTVVDVGGNTGALVEALLARYPDLCATLLDLPAFAHVARQRFADSGMSDRATVIGRSFFDLLPEGADVYVLSSVLADWDDASAVRLLRNCADAAGKDGRILVSEVCLTEHLQRADTAMALWLEAAMENPDRTVEDISILAAEAGLSVARVDRAPTRMVLELY
ncbi:methyltransferase [Planomonospora sp. ID82291]|uniref:methyltransferase n=1 Tax=Planomonospora sp. ID82291 TaxID=2738136 RepID=UPI0018C3CD42|nr:methyltransferase [Planomonospora sp. ID82291]MBG0812791.1 methyltransferase [Planomonospora sp. ID82291]